MEQKKAVLFNFWGVVGVRSPLSGEFQRFEEASGLPCGFVWKAASQLDGVLTRAERGQITLSQMILELDSQLVREAKAEGVTLPADWTVADLLTGVSEVQAEPAVLQAAVSLRRSGILTAVLANRWVDDTATGDGWARLLTVLGGHFDLVLHSCHAGFRVPEPSVFTAALRQLQVTAQQALYLAEDEEGVRAAEGQGMKAVLVDRLEDTLQELARFTGVPVDLENTPLSCDPDKMSHGYVSIRPGVRTHYVQMGCGPPVLLCHGFPESWYSWRYQIPALAAAGFSVFALDMKGYGESTAPADIEEYSGERLCEDLIAFLDILAIPQVTLVGHDWGGMVVWDMARYYPERVRAVASLNTPLFPVNPTVDPMEKLKAAPVFEYQIYFQKPGVAEAELEKDLERSFKIFFDSDSETLKFIARGTCIRGGLFVGLPEEFAGRHLLNESDLQYYIDRFKEQGFRRPLNWYRNVERNWRWKCSRPGGKLMMPALMVTAGRDTVLLPVMSKGMEDIIPNLTRRHIEDCGHWTQVERPAELNQILTSWLQQTHRKLAETIPPKL